MKKRYANRVDEGPESVGESWQELVESAQALLASLQNEKGDAVDRVREKLSATVETATSRIAALRDSASDMGQQAAKSTLKYVRRNPWTSVAIAAAIVLGLSLLNSSDDDD